MIAAISRLTTDYVDTEDRMCLAGEVAQAPPMVMWLTQRLALRLVPALLQWLDGQTGVAPAEGPAAPRPRAADVQSQVVHGFAQEAARAALEPQQPVQADPSRGWLIQSIDLTPAGQRIALVFRAADGRAAGVGVNAQELRQWLAIVHGLWRRAGWPEAPWPDWMQGEAAPTGRQIVLH